MSKTKLERIASLDEQMTQLANQKKKLMQQHKEQERKARTKRLIERGAILEGFISNAETLTNEQVKELLQVAFDTAPSPAKLNEKPSTSTAKPPAEPATPQRAAPAPPGGGGGKQKEG